MASPSQATAQLLDFVFDQSKSTLYVIDSSKNDTLCKEPFILNVGSNPVWCQNDSLFFVLTELSLQTVTCYDFFVYKKNNPCAFISTYTHKEQSRIVIRKTTVKSESNKIIVEFNDCGDIKSILNFDPYTMNISDARMQFVLNSRKL
jgi:hypothetical protein